MTVYVDTLHDYGWVVLGQRKRSCHMFTNTVDLSERHDSAARIGMPLDGFQNKIAAPHCDLKPGYRDAAVLEGAVAVDRRQHSGRHDAHSFIYRPSVVLAVNLRCRCVRYR